MTDPGLSLARALRGAPGIQIHDRGHFALGERVLVRGTGYRSAFGVRGIQILLDGIPLTIADGQSMTDIVEPALVKRAEILRGPSAVFWGNSSGGVLHLVSARQDSTRVRVRGLLGGHGVQHLLAETRLPLRTGWLGAYASRARRTGAREHSQGTFVRAGVRGQIQLSQSTTLAVTSAAAIQDVLAPGSLTRAQMDQNSSMADPRYVAAGAGKESTHLQAGSTLRSATRLGLLTITAYGISRSLYNPLTFATIDLDRLAAGSYAQLQGQQNMLAWTVGWDMRWQHDNRRNRRDGQDVLNQIERVRSLSASSMIHLALGTRWRLTGGGRLDAVRFAMDDQYHANGDQSGQRTMAALSPAAGLTYHTGDLVFYINAGTAFETPTTTELVNRPDADGGFHPNLGPQRLVGSEAGLRGVFRKLRLQADLALFWMRISDRLLPQQNEDGRTWYANEGNNEHRGVELAARWPLGSPLQLQIAMSEGYFVFLNNPGKGLDIPGVPRRRSQVSIRYERKGLSLEIAADMASSTWADNANTARSDGHMAMDFYVGHRAIMTQGVAMNPFLSVTNVFDTRYATSLVVNAFGGRYFEPAPGRALQAGVAIAF